MDKIRQYFTIVSVQTAFEGSEKFRRSRKNQFSFLSVNGNGPRNRSQSFSANAAWLVGLFLVASSTRETYGLNLIELKITRCFQCFCWVDQFSFPSPGPLRQGTKTSFVYFSTLFRTPRGLELRRRGGGACCFWSPSTLRPIHTQPATASPGTHF